jgi:hypothetical protein
MLTSKDGNARTEIGQHNMINVAMEDLPEAEGAALEMELQEEMAHVFPKNMHRGDQEGHRNHHDYRDYGYGIHGNSKHDS